jgi:hypothetical protein
LKESAHCQFVGWQFSGSFFTMARKNESATENFKKNSQAQFVLTCASEGGQSDRDEARSKIGAQNPTQAIPAGNAHGFCRGCLSLEV